MSDMLSTFRTEATARLAELDKSVAWADQMVSDAREARRAFVAERDELQRALAGSVKRTRRAATTSTTAVEP